MASADTVPALDSAERATSCAVFWWLVGDGCRGHDASYVGNNTQVSATLIRFIQPKERNITLSLSTSGRNGDNAVSKIHTVAMEHLLSANHCKLLRCALEVIGRTSADTMRITTVPVENKPETKQTTQNTTNPHSSQNEHQDRVQRRKEKKRRKMELRKQRREESTIKSDVVTTTSFSTKAAVSVPSDSSQVQVVSIPPSRAIIHVKPLIILDVNGILCHRLRHKPEGLQLSASHRRSKQIITFRQSIGHVANTDIVPRSDLHQFLTSLNNSFNLAVCEYDCIVLLFSVTTNTLLTPLGTYMTCKKLQGLAQQEKQQNS